MKRITILICVWILCAVSFGQITSGVPTEMDVVVTSPLSDSGNVNTTSLHEDGTPGQLITGIDYVSVRIGFVLVQVNI